MSKYLSSLLFAFTAIVVVVVPCQAADVFLRLDGVPGESRDDKYRDTIDVMNFSWGGQQSGSMHLAGGAGAGKAAIGDITLVKHVDKASPLLSSLMCSGKIIPRGSLIVRYSREGKEFNYKMELEKVLITSYGVNYGEGPEAMTETISLNFGKVRWIYQSANMADRNTYEKGFDVMQNIVQ